MNGPEPAAEAAPPRAAPPPAPGSRTWWAALLPLPTGRAAVLVAAVAVAVLVVPLPATTATALVAGPVVLVLVLVAADAWWSPSPWRIAVGRELPQVVTLDGAAQVVWRVANPAARRAQVAVADELVPSLGAMARRFRVALPAGGRTRVEVPLAPQRRGTFRPTEMTVRVVGPLGLGFRQATRALPGRIEVHPSFRSRDAAELRIRRGRILEHGLRSVRGRGGGAQFEALRDYVQGDEFRHVDWAATARRGHPVVRTYRPERNQTVVVLLDTGRLTAGLVDGVPRLEHGMDATLALATVATRLGDRTGLVAFGADVRMVVPPSRAGDQLRRLSRAMHALEPELVESSYREAFQVTLARFRRRALLVLVSELGAEAVQETLLPALPLVVREHAVIVASVEDPAVASLRDVAPAAPRDAYRAAGATAVLSARHRAIARLQATGVRVVDAPPGALAARLADAYLDVKATGGL